MKYSLLLRLLQTEIILLLCRPELGMRFISLRKHNAHSPHIPNMCYLHLMLGEDFGCAAFIFSSKAPHSLCGSYITVKTLITTTAAQCLYELDYLSTINYTQTCARVRNK